jgi:tetratricopeptide (TPR) repeat protein
MRSRIPEPAREALPWLLCGAALLAALVAVVYAPVLANGFVWDDWSVVVGTRGLRPLTAEGLRWSFTALVQGHYHPATWLSFTVGERLLGDAPASAHAVNVALHALNAALFAVLGAELLAHARPEWSPRARAAAALFAAALFALHPLRVESVAWATERRDVLSAAFLLGALAAYVVRSRARRPAAWYAVSLALFALALLAKAQASAAAVLLVLDVYPLARLPGGSARRKAAAFGRLVVEKVPFVALAAAAAVLALRAQAASGALLATAAHPVGARFAQAAYGLVFYLRATFATAFRPLYERPVPLDWREARFALSIAAAALLAAGMVACRRRAPALAAAAAAYLLFLLPVSGFFQSGVQLVADRYSYLATLGFALVAAAAAVERWRTAAAAWHRPALAASCLALLAAWASLSHGQTRIWRDDETVWRHVLEGGPSALASNNLGQMLAARGRYAEATTHLARALEVVPSYPRPWTALLALLEAGVVPVDTARAVAPALTASAERQPASVGAWYALGLARARAGDLPGASAAFERAQLLQPGHPGAAAGLAALRRRAEVLPDD